MYDGFNSFRTADPRSLSGLTTELTGSSIGHHRRLVGTKPQEFVPWPNGADGTTPLMKLRASSSDSIKLREPAVARGWDGVHHRVGIGGDRPVRGRTTLAP